MKEAVAGEVWAVEFDGGSNGCQVFIHEDRTIGTLAGVGADGFYYELDNPRVTAARRVWPEGA